MIESRADAPVPMVVVMGGRPGSLPDQVAAGTHPNVEFLELIGRHGMALCCYDELDGTGRFLRMIARCFGQHWALALLTFQRFRHGEMLIATGEDVGFPLAIVHGLRSRRRRARVAVIAHGSYLNSARARLISRPLRRRDDVWFWALSTTIAAMLVEHLGLRTAQVSSVGYGTDVGFFQAEDRDAGEHRFRVASAGMANRDYQTLIDAMADVEGELKIAADSAWFPTELDIDHATLPDDVEVRSYGTYVELRGLYGSSDVVVVPLHEARHACGYAVIAEAMAMGRPVIATRTSGHSDLFEDGVSGWYVAPGDVEGLRERLRLVRDRPALAAEVGARARAEIEQHDSVQAVADRIAAAAAAAVGAAEPLAAGRGRDDGGRPFSGG